MTRTLLKSIVRNQWPISSAQVADALPIPLSRQSMAISLIITDWSSLSHSEQVRIVSCVAYRVGGFGVKSPGARVNDLILWCTMLDMLMFVTWQ